MRLAVLAAAVVLTLLGCHRDATMLIAPGSPRPPDTSSHIVGAPLTCIASIGAATPQFDCASATGASERRDGRAMITVGGQGAYVQLNVAKVTYSAATQTLAVDVTLQNLMAQKLGTVDGTMINGVRAFISSGPTATQGSGAIAVANADGTARLTANDQPYFFYGQILDGYGGTSLAKTWRFTVPTTATAFTLTALVSANVPEESGTLRWLVESGQVLDRPTALWGADSRNVFASGPGTAYRYNAQEWRAFGSGRIMGYYTSIWGTSPSDIYVVGQFGRVAHYDGVDWAMMPGTPLQTLRGVWTRRGTSVWSVSDSGLVLRSTGLNGFSWTGWRITQLSQIALNGVQGTSDSDVWIVGNAGTTFHYNGADWAAWTSNTTNDLLAVWPLSSGDVWAVGRAGTILHFTGSAWSPASSPTSCDVTSLSALSSRDIWAATGCGSVLHYDGNMWGVVNTGLSSYFVSIWTGSDNDVWVLDRQTGGAVHFDGSAWRTVTGSARPLADLRAVWGSTSNDVWAVGSGGAMLHRTASGWSSIATGVPNFLAGVWGSSPNDVWTVGSEGLLLHYNGSSWSAVNSGVTNFLTGIWGASRSSVVVVGSLGMILRFDGVSWSPQTSGVLNDLYAVGGSSATNVWAVGNQGTMVHYDGSAWTPTASGTALELFTVCADALDDAWAFGDAGVIVHFNGTNWSRVASPTAFRIWGSWCGAPNNVWAVDDWGSIVHYDGRSWNVVSSGTSAILNGIWGTGGSAAGATATEVFVVGAAPGVVLRGTR